MLRQSSADMKELIGQSRIDPVLARILAVRGYRSAKEIYTFLHPEEAMPADPFLFADMERAVEIAAETIRTGQKCLIYGDYDADGIMSTFIMLRTFASLGGDVDYYIPKREEEGYGLNNQAIGNLYEQGYRVIFACDNGISSFEQIEYANQLGMTMVVLDHHSVYTEKGDAEECQKLPPAAAVVDAKRLDCPYPFKEYCAAVVCYRFSEALHRYMEQDWQALQEELLPFLTIATICDLVSLTGENRFYVKQGLPSVVRSHNLGLKALLQAAGIDNRPIDSYEVGFVIGPCINASGRMDIADTALELFLAEDEETAIHYANKLVELNNKRKSVTEDGFNLALEYIADHGLEKYKVIVIYHPDIQESVAGIVAGRIKETFHKPTIVLAGHNDIVRGSCRSVEGFNIYEGLLCCESLLVMFGGHPMAAGLSIDQNDIDAFREKINSCCTLEEDDFQEVYRIDCPLMLSGISLQLAEKIRELAPFGKDNKEPVFASKQGVLRQITLLGKEGNVMRWALAQEGQGGHQTGLLFGQTQAFLQFLRQRFGEQTDAIWEKLLQGKGHLMLDLLYHIKINVFHSSRTVQLNVLDYRLAQ